MKLELPLRNFGRANLLVAPVLIATVALLALASGCQTSHPPDKVVLVPVDSFAKKWSLPLNLNKRHDELTALYLREDQLFAYSKQNLVVSIRPDSGTSVFEEAIHPGELPNHAPILVKDWIAIPASSTIELYTKDGKHVSTAPTGVSIRSNGVALGSSVYISLDYPAGGRLAAMDFTRRFEFTRWELVTKNRSGISSAPTVYQNNIYVADEGGAVRAVSEEKTAVWVLSDSIFQTDGRIMADLVSDSGSIYVASGDSKLYCIDGGSSGRLRWQYYASEPLVDSPVVTGDTVYQPVPHTGIVAIDKNVGKSNRDAKWICKGANKFLSQDDKFVYLRSTDNRILGVDRSTGEIKFRSQRSDLVAFATNLKSPVIYAGTRDGEVIAINPITKPGTMGAIVMAPASDPLRHDDAQLAIALIGKQS